MQSSVKAPARLVHRSSGRTRLRVAPEHRNAEMMQQLEERLRSLGGVRSVEAKPATGSLLLSHEPEGADMDEISEALSELGLGLELVESLASRGRTPIAEGMINQARNLNDALSRSTNGQLDLRIVVPVGLVVLALMRRGEQGLSNVPAHALVWYAYNMFVGLHGKQAQAGGGA